MGRFKNKLTQSYAKKQKLKREAARDITNVCGCGNKNCRFMNAVDPRHNITQDLVEDHLIETFIITVI